MYAPGYALGLYVPGHALGLGATVTSQRAKAGAEAVPGHGRAHRLRGACARRVGGGPMRALFSVYPSTPLR
jgi:hypothetical protein